MLFLQSQYCLIYCQISQSPPLILVAGDCTGSAYIFTPSADMPSTFPSQKTPLKYKLAFEIECGATVNIYQI